MASQMKSKEDFLFLLNYIKKVDMEEKGLVMHEFRPFTENSNTFLAGRQHIPDCRQYRHF